MNPKLDEDSLYNFLMKNKDKVVYVNLRWTWNEMKVVESDRCLIEDGRPYEVYIGFDVITLDWEYSFTGTYDDAIKFAESYDCWDGFDFESNLKYGVLEMEHHGDNFDYHYHPEELDPDEDCILEISCLGLYTWFNSKDGNNIAPVYTWQDDQLMLWSEWKKLHPEEEE